MGKVKKKSEKTLSIERKNRRRLTKTAVVKPKEQRNKKIPQPVRLPEEILKVNTVRKDFKIPIKKRATNLDKLHCPVDDVHVNQANQSIINKKTTSATSCQNLASKTSNGKDQKDDSIMNAQKESKINKKQILRDKCKSSARRRHETEMRKQKRLNKEYKNKERDRESKMKKEKRIDNKYKESEKERETKARKEKKT